MGRVVTFFFNLNLEDEGMWKYWDLASFKHSSVTMQLKKWSLWMQPDNPKCGSFYAEKKICYNCDIPKSRYSKKKWMSTIVSLSLWGRDNSRQVTLGTSHCVTDHVCCMHLHGSPPCLCVIAFDNVLICLPLTWHFMFRCLQSCPACNSILQSSNSPEHSVEAKRTFLFLLVEVNDLKYIYILVALTDGLHSIASSEFVDNQNVCNSL